MENISSKIDKLKIDTETKERLKKVFSYSPKVAILGQSGKGKSSLLNAMFGSHKVAISALDGCTRKEENVKIENGLTVTDLPGIGENPERHDEYMKLYKKVLPTVDLVLWVLPSSERSYATDVDFFDKELRSNLEKRPVLLVLSKIDKLAEDFDDWDNERYKPGQMAEKKILEKVISISGQFRIPANYVVPIAIKNKYDENLDEHIYTGINYNIPQLVTNIIELLPNEKKLGFADTVKEENVTEEAKENAEKGFWEYVSDGLKWGKEKIWEYKEEIISIIAPRASRVIKAIFSVFG